MSAPFSVVFAMLAIAGIGLWFLSIQYSAERLKVTLPDGPTFDVLVHREEVMLYTSGAAYANAYSVAPTVAALAKRARNGPWQWAVTVRQSTFAGYKNLVHEVFDAEPDALARANETAGLIARGERLWPEQAEL